MHRKAWPLLVAIASLALAPVVVAEDADTEKNWSNKTELGFVSTTGNTENTNFALANKYTRSWDRSDLVFNAFALRAEQTTRILSNPDGTVDVAENTETTAEQYGLGLKYTRQIRERLGWYGTASWFQDEFAGIDSRVSAGAGLAYTFFETDGGTLIGEVGADYTDEERVDGSSDSWAGARAFAGYNRKFGKNAEFSSELEFLLNTDDTDDWRGNWGNSVTASLTDKLAVKVSYLMKYDNQPVVLLVAPNVGAPPGTPDAPFEFDELDTVLSASLVVNF